MADLPLHLRAARALMLIAFAAGIALFGYAFYSMDWKPQPKPQWLIDAEERSRERNQKEQQ